MSLLSSATQGTPERVLSALQVLAAHGGVLPRNELVAWLNPPFSVQGEARSVTGTAADGAITAATDLGFVTIEGAACQLAPELANVDHFALADLAHDRLIAAPAEEADGVLMRGFAIVAARSVQQQGLTWVRGPNSALVAAINDALPDRPGTDADALKFNTSKVAPFWRWMVFIGLACELTDSYYPYVAARLDAELRRSGLPVGEETPIRDVLEVVARRMPYLDGGALYAEAADHFRLPATGRALSPLLSIALRDLHEEGRLALGVRADATGIVPLSPDPFSRIDAVQFVTLTPKPAA